MDVRVQAIHKMLHAIDQLDHSELSRGNVKAAGRDLTALHKELMKNKGIDCNTDNITYLFTLAEKGNWTELNRARGNGKLPSAREELKSIATLYKADDEMQSPSRAHDSGKDRGYPPQYSANSDAEYVRRKQETQMEHRDRRPLGQPSSAPALVQGNPKVASAQISRIAGHRLRDSKSADVPELQTPPDLADAFSMLFNSQWADAYDELNASTRDAGETIRQLLKILEEAHAYCVETAERQLTDMLMHVEDDILYPNITQRSRAAIEAAKSPDGRLLAMIRDNDEVIKEYRRGAAQASLPVVKWLFYEEVMKTLMPVVHHTTKTVRYCDRCVEVVWMMCVQNPPMHLQFCGSGERFNSSLFKPFTKSGTVVQNCVWPAVFEHRGGAMMVKGLAHLA